MKSVEKSIGVASAERFLRIIAALTDSASIRTYLEGVGAVILILLILGH